ncbi:MAG: LexA family transcriptional regulator [Chlorobi bacterium]|nr:LexA family transcriptional regulator [Chlorobiota bacterium]
MKYFSSNIKFLRKRRGRTQDDVAFALGMKRPTLSGYENGIAEPGMDALVAFSGYYRIAIDTLIRVDISALSESQLSQLERGADVYIKGSKLRVLATTVNPENEENIELVSEKAKAGYRTGYADPEFISHLPAFQLPFLSPDRKYRTFQIKGDSMLPIPDGSWVTGEFLQDWNTLVNGQAYVIFTLDDGIVFKIVENLMKKHGVLRLYSLNPVYEPYDVPVQDIREIWKFVHYISAEIPEPAIPENHLLSMVARLKKDVDRLNREVHHS